MSRTDTHTYSSGLIVSRNLYLASQQASGPVIFATPAAIVKRPPGTYSVHDVCPHCDNSGRQRIRILRNPSSTLERGLRQTYHDGRWWEYTEQAFDCPACNPTGARAFAELSAASGLQPSDYDKDMRRDLDMPERREAILAAMELASLFPQTVGWFSLFGLYGTGKTTLAKCLVAEATRRGVRARFVQASDLLDELTDTIDHSDISMKGLIDRYVEGFGVLAVDEVTEIGDKENAHRRLRAILNGRYERRGERLTIITTNADPLNMPDGWGYLDSRMADGKRYIMGGGDSRKS